MVYQTRLLLKEIDLIAGVDEVGCDSLVGLVIAISVVLHPAQLI